MILGVIGPFLAGCCSPRAVFIGSINLFHRFAGVIQPYIDVTINGIQLVGGRIAFQMEILGLTNGIVIVISIAFIRLPAVIEPDERGIGDHLHPTTEFLVYELVAPGALPVRFGGIPFIFSRARLFTKTIVAVLLLGFTYATAIGIDSPLFFFYRAVRTVIFIQGATD